MIATGIANPKGELNVVAGAGSVWVASDQKGVIAREVTLLPRHWEWLAAQPGGASAALRRLVEDARRAAPADRRQAQEAVHRVMFALAGDLPDFEEANRAFYAKDYERFDVLTASWPPDVGDYVRTLVRRAGVAGDQR